MFNLMPWRKKESESASLEQTRNPVVRLRDEIDTLFDRFMSGWSGSTGLEPVFGRSWGFDLIDGEDEVTVKAELPGFEAGDLDVQAAGQMLTIKAEKRREGKKEGNGNVHERSYTSFRRSVPLPAGADPEKIEATYRNGVLEVHVPKSEQAKGKRIAVNS